MAKSRNYLKRLRIIACRIRCLENGYKLFIYVSRGLWRTTANLPKIKYFDGICSKENATFIGAGAQKIEHYL
jgi:hypothetical protein